MELRGPDVGLAQPGGEGETAVIGGRGDVGGIVWHAVKRVQEVGHRMRVRLAFPKRRPRPENDVVQADLRDLEARGCWEAADMAGDDVEPADAWLALLAVGEQDLHADADTE